MHHRFLPSCPEVTPTTSRTVGVASPKSHEPTQSHRPSLASTDRNPCHLGPAERRRALRAGRPRGQKPRRERRGQRPQGTRQRDHRALAVRSRRRQQWLLPIKHDVRHAPELEDRGPGPVDHGNDEGADVRLRDARYQRRLRPHGQHRGHRVVLPVRDRPHGRGGRSGEPQSEQRQPRPRHRQRQHRLQQHPDLGARAGGPALDGLARAEPGPERQHLWPGQRLRDGEPGPSHRQSQPQFHEGGIARRQLRRLARLHGREP